MRNLKRALSLTLASVMLLGMMVTGAGAAGFPDVADDRHNVEAIEVLKAVDVMIGDENGNFGPDDPVNRAQMAVIMAKLLKLNYNYYEGADPGFWDVPSWAAPYVAACYANSIVSGYGNGQYGSGDGVTATQAASMMMRALGYFKYTEDYKDGFELATVRQGSEIGIFDGVGSRAGEGLTRNEVARMALNALRSEMVTFTGTPGVTVGDVTVGYRAEYTPRTSTEIKYNSIEGRTSDVASDANHKGQYYIQLGEELYDGRLKLHDTTDAFGRPARQWEYNAKEVGTYVKSELLRGQYTAGVTGKTLYNLLTKPTIEKYDFTISIDGIETTESSRGILGGAWFTEDNLVNTNTKNVGGTGNGVLTQVYVDDNNDRQMVYIAVINTYLAKAVDDYKTNKEEVDFTVWSAENKGSRSDVMLVKNTGKSETLTVKNEDISVENVKEDDVVLVRVAEGEIREIFDPEVIDSTEISAFKNGSWVNANGTQYDYASSIQYDVEVLDEYDDRNMKDTTYRVFLDSYGYAIGVEIIDNVEDYVFLTGIDLDTSNLYNKTADGNVIHVDGTMETVRINMDSSRNAYNEKFAQATAGRTGVNSLMNTWCTFTVDGKGVYTLTEVANDNTSFTTRFAGDSIAVYADTAKRQNDKLGQGHEERSVTLDKAHAGLLGIADNGSGFKTVHANDDSIFLSAKTELIMATDVLSTTTNKIPSVIINDVETVETGIQNVDIKSYDAAQVIASNDKYQAADPDDVSCGVYTLFRDNGYVVAAVVVGEDDGAASNYAFITSSVKKEAYDKEKDEWTWSVDAVVNGEKVVLEEKGSSSSSLKYMSKGEWYEVRYKGDGTVRKTTLITPESAVQGSHASTAYIFCGNPGHVAAGYPKFIGLMEMKEASYDAGNNTIVLYQDLTSEEHSISAKGRTLQIDTEKDFEHRDITVTANAKVVLVQDVEKVDNAGNRYGVDIMDRVEECGEGQNGLKKAVDWLEDNSMFYGYVGAVIEDGVATSVVIWDRTAYEVNIGGGNNRPTGEAKLVWTDNGGNDQYWTLTIPADEWNENMTTAGISYWLAKAGCSEISKTRNGWNFTRNGMDYTDQVVVVVPNGRYVITRTEAVNGTVNVQNRADAGDRITISYRADAGYELDAITVTAEDGSDITVRNNSFTMPAQNVTVTVTFKAVGNPPADKDVTITVKGTAINGNHYDVDGLTDGKIVLKAGEELTITANKQIAVYEVASDGTATREEVAAKGTKTITAEEDITVVINRFRAEFVGDLLTQVEKTDGDTPVMPAAARAYARAARAGEVFVKICLEGEFAPDKTYVVKVVSGGYLFGKDTTAEMRSEIVDALDEADVANADIEINVLDEEVTEEEIKAWEGSSVEEPEIGDPQQLPVQAAITGGNVTFKAYFGNKKDVQLTQENIAAALTAADHETSAENVDIKNKKAVADKGESLSWTGDSNVDGAGKLNKVVNTNELFKITLPTKTVYGASGLAVNLGDFEPQILISASAAAQGRSDNSNALDGKSVVPDGNNVVTFTTVSKDDAYVEGFHFIWTADTQSTADQHVWTTSGKMTVSDVADNNVLTYIARVSHGKDGAKNNVEGCHTSSLTDENSWIAKDAVLTFKADETANSQKAVKGQVLTIKVNGETVQTLPVIETGKAPEIKPITITEPVSSDDPDRDGAVIIEFKMSAAPDPEESKELYFNGRKVEADEDGKYRFTGLDHNTKVMYEGNDGVLSGTMSTGFALDYPTNEDLQDENGTATYTWTDGEKVTLLDQDAPDTIRLWTVYEVDTTDSGKKVDVYKEITGKGDFVAVDSTKKINSTKEYFKTVEETTLYVECNAAGTYIWFAAAKSMDGLKVLRMPTTSVKGIWEIKLNGSLKLDSTGLTSAYKISNGFKAEASSGTWTYGSWNKITVTPDGSTAIATGNEMLIESIEWEVEPDNANLKFEIAKDSTDGKWKIRMVSAEGTGAAPTNGQVVVKLMGSDPVKVNFTAS